MKWEKIGKIMDRHNFNGVVVQLFIGGLCLEAIGVNIILLCRWYLGTF